MNSFYVDFKNGKFVDVSNAPPFWNEDKIKAMWPKYQDNQKRLDIYWSIDAQLMAVLLWG